MNRLAAATGFALLAFAANSVLCRMALRAAHIDPASFMSIRLLSGAATLWLLVRLGRGGQRLGGDWRSALALLTYAIAFTFAYVGLTAGTGALLLFGAVQVVMIAAGFVGGERIDRSIALGWLLAVAGLIMLLLPGISAPPARDAIFMLIAGCAWGVYSLRGRRSLNALADTAGNFSRALPGTLLVSALLWGHRSADAAGVVLAALSGSIASGLGYAAWYTALPRLGAIAAANAQLSVPVIAALAGVALFSEPVTVRLAAASVLVLGGTALAVRRTLTLRTAPVARDL
ncbi:MAG TPA: DMT family transporter [Steroidobacteraceae bacterium]|nr:DMT family transporter [Steroidobacteraceae bacterium]